MNPNDQVEIKFAVVCGTREYKDEYGIETICWCCITILKDCTRNNYKNGCSLLISPFFKKTRYSRILVKRFYWGNERNCFLI